MCGIIGIISKNNEKTIDNILFGLKKLEYRGYDSAGIGFIFKNDLRVIKKEGKIVNLEKTLSKNNNLQTNIAIGHTRWATHGKPSEQNSHPHQSDKICVVHNGIIENYQDLKDKLIKDGIKFQSQTDSEVIPHLISFYLKKHNNLKKAVFAAINDIKGSFALGIIFKDSPDSLICAKKGSPLLIGYGEGENFIASDYFALDNLTHKISYLEDGDVAFLSKEKVDIFDSEQNLVKRKIKKIDLEIKTSNKGDFKHFMLKEIFEQPKVVQDSLNKYLDLENSEINLGEFPFNLANFNKITIIACGTSYYAAMAAKYLFESLARIKVEVDIASEFRYRDVVFDDDNLMIFISQSGETADTIAALKYAKEHKQKILSIVNVDQSSMEHLSDYTIKTMAGIEIGVASTKVFTAQLVVLILLAIKIAEIRKTIKVASKKEMILNLKKIPNYLNHILSNESIDQIKLVAKFISKAKNILYIGRGISYPICLEGALKLKELSYIPTLGIASGELKHGTLALIDKNIPIIALAANGKLFDKSASNIEEIAARDGKVILISDKEAIKKLKNITFKNIELPKNNDMISELLLSAIPTQLIAYYSALFKGNDVDQPRNLAKSVTVE